MVTNRLCVGAYRMMHEGTDLLESQEVHVLYGNSTINEGLQGFDDQERTVTMSSTRHIIVALR